MTSDSPARSFAPPRAVLCWSDGRELFAEFPGPDSRPVILRYPLTASGLSSALALVATARYDSPAAPIQTVTPTSPGTPAQRENARALLRQMRVIA